MLYLIKKQIEVIIMSARLFLIPLLSLVSYTTVHYHSICKIPLNPTDLISALWYCLSIC